MTVDLAVRLVGGGALLAGMGREDAAASEGAEPSEAAVLSLEQESESPRECLKARVVRPPARTF